MRSLSSHKHPKATCFLTLPQSTPSSVLPPSVRVSVPHHHVHRGVATPATAKIMYPELRSLSPSQLAAVLPTKAMPRHFAPAEAVGEAVVRAIGRQGPVVVPYW